MSRVSEPLASKAPANVPLFDLRAQHVGLADSLQAAFERVQSRSAFILGEEVAAFERACARALDVPHAVGVSSGSDALLLALLALGIGVGDEVITSPFTFAATAEAIARAGATPVFADVDPLSLCLSAESAQSVLSPRTRALLCVHLYGDPGNVEELSELCTRKGLLLIEDACQAFGAAVSGRAAGSFGHVGCFSFFPTKPLGAMGDGGLCVTHDATVARELSRLRVHGMNAEGNVVRLGGNYRLDALQAALLREKLAFVETWRCARARHAHRYAEALHGCPRIGPVFPSKPAVRHAWAVTTLRVRGERDQLKTHLARQGIESRVYYPRLLSEHAVFRTCPRGNLTQAERASREVLSIPNHFGLGDEAHARVVSNLLAWASCAR